MDCPRLTVRFSKPGEFRYFWIKYVKGFDPRNHCARCLVGDFSRAIRYREIRDLEDIPLDEYATQWIYICGVTSRWEWNLHIAGQYSPGENVEYKDERVTVTVQDFKRLDITATGNPPAPKEFATCRNWQFGWNAYPNTPIEPLLF